MTEPVRAWAETITIPTYRIGEPDKNPMFLEKRVYQGSSGVVYPHPVIDRVFDEKVDRPYLALFLENRYLKIMILPELGGRVQMALDKTNGYQFVYYNEVIKPALVGLTGPWISGGIEFNWPQHHRPSTFLPLQWRIEEHEDGSRTVWCAEIERMFRTKGMHGFRLHPDRAYLEINVQLYNRTAEPQTFLWWANPAVHVHEDYQSVFPPDVHAVMDHGKRDVSSFPIATGTYYKVNYGANGKGTDISRYKNIPVPTSYMAYHSDFDFIGDYDHRAQAGMLHVAEHHVVPGKKQWTWGNCDFGQAWDRQLTDSNGPYIELMCGAFTDNQPDFSWIMPGEEKRFTQIFMPYQQIGPANNASKDAALHLDVEDGIARLGVYVTSPRSVRVELRFHNEVLFEQSGDLAPDAPMIKSVSIPSQLKPQELTLCVLGRDDQSRYHKLLEYTPLPAETPQIPSPMAPAKAPAEIASNEELFLNGLHLEQYRHANYVPEDYYEEALRRDPGDSRCNNAMGLLLYRRGKFAEAEPFFRRAIERLTLRNPNPYDGEAYYNLGLSLKMQGRLSEAFDAFYKSVWNAAWQDAGYFELARLAARAGRLEEALTLAKQALRRNHSHHKARHLLIALLRQMGEYNQAREQAKFALELDPVEYGGLWEQWLLDGNPLFKQIVGGEANTCLELALDYANAGMWTDAVDLLEQADATGETGPILFYTKGWLFEQAGQDQAAHKSFAQAAALSPDFCFPNRLEDVLILESALRANSADYLAAYALGNFWYGHRRYEEAITCWEQAREANPGFATVQRNLSLAYYNKRADTALALTSMERAFALNSRDARVLFELDQLYKKLNRAPQERLANLNQYFNLVQQRDDLFIEYVTLHNLLKQPDNALALIMQHSFHPWEGGEGKATSQYVTALVEQARAALAASDPKQAIELLNQAQTLPHNLGEGKLVNAQENNIFYYLGKACAFTGDLAQAQAAYERAAVGQSEPASAMFYNDQPPDMIYYQGLARAALGRQDEARQVFEKLVAYGENHLNDIVKMDYFAVSLPDFQVFDEDLTRMNQIHCHYMLGLGLLGLGNHSETRQHFNQVLAMNPAHLGAVLRSSEIE